MAPRKKSASGDAKPKKPTSERQRAHLDKARAARSDNACNMGGRPSLYKDEYARIARVMCQNGARDSELADAFDVTTQTIWDWQSRHKEFGAALKVGKGEYDDRVERAFAQRAMGYSYDTEKIFMPPGAKEAVRVTYREHVPPDPTAAFKWLSCRRMKEWRDRQEITGPDGGPLMPIIALLKEVNGGTASLVQQGTASLVQQGTERACAPVLRSNVEAEQPLLDHRQERQEGEI